MKDARRTWRILATLAAGAALGLAVACDPVRQPRAPSVDPIAAESTRSPGISDLLNSYRIPPRQMTTDHDRGLLDDDHWRFDQ